MEKLHLNVMGRDMSVEPGTTFGALAQELQKDFPSPILLAKQGNNLQELGSKIQDGDAVTFYDLSDGEGMRVYHRGVSLVLVKAVRDIVGETARVQIEHSLRGNLYCEIRQPETPLDVEFLSKVEKRMREMIDADLPIEKRTFRKDEAIEIAKKQHMEPKAKLFRFRRASNVNLYELDGFYDYFYGYMPLSTGVLKVFALELYGNGFLIRFPNPEKPDELLPFEDPKKISGVFMEQMEWCRLMEAENVADLNEAIVNGHFGDLIRINEALHEKKIAEIADQIYHRMPNVRVVLIAGPSSSGKTSFANRLCVQLRVLGIKPHKVSLDDYFINRDKTPLDENGKRNFERIEALDLKQLNKDLKAIIAGEQIELPYYNFVTGKREYNGDYLQLGEGEILVMEGIHGLNDRLTPEIPDENKFKIFISALTQLNIDDHNRISTSDCRLIRRIVRDYQFRGRDARGTIEAWNTVTQGEEENIFPFQESADAMFNSVLIYELAVLKQYAEPLLFGIGKGEPEYYEAKRLLKFLEYFIGVSSDNLPKNSICREFIGGSCFHV